MRYIDLDDGRVPTIGFGTFALRAEDCVRGTATALEIGYRHIDTAQEYDNEVEVGCAINGSGIDRGEIFLTTKIWPDRIGDGDLQRAADESLERLATTYVDLLLIHWPSPTIPLGESLKALAEVKAAGKARHIGISNFPVALMRAAVETHGASVVCNQVEYHPFLDQRRLIDCDMLQEMRMVLKLHRTPGFDDSVPTSHQVLRMATENGAHTTPFGVEIGTL